MPKLVTENPITKQIHTYLIVCDEDISELLGEDINTVAISLSSLKKAAKSIQNLPVGDIISYQQLMEDLSVANNTIQNLDLIHGKTSEDYYKYVRHLSSYRNRIEKLSFWNRCSYLFHGYKQFIIDIENEFFEQEKS